MNELLSAIDIDFTQMWRRIMAELNMKQLYCIKKENHPKRGQIHLLRLIINSNHQKISGNNLVNVSWVNRSHCNAFIMCLNVSHLL